MTAPEDPNGLREAPEPIPQNYSWHTTSATFYNHSGENWVGITSPFHRKWQPRYHEFPLWTPKGPLRDASDAAWATLRSERDAAVQLAYDLKYAAAGGEDVPGSANAVTVADVDRWRREATTRINAAEAELDEERQESARLAHLAVVLECERNAHHKALKLAMQFVDCAAGEGLSFDADGDRPAMDAADVCFAVAEALGIEDLDSDAYRALVARP